MVQIYSTRVFSQYLTFLFFLISASGSLTKHEATHYDQVQKKYKCDVCQKSFITPSRLNDHKMSIHSDSRSFKCAYCEKLYKTKQQAKSHERKLHVQKLLLDEICEFCGKAYAFKVYLRDHLISLHNLSLEEASKSAKIRDRRLLRIPPKAE